MSQKMVIILTDDLSGGEAHETIRLGLDGREYEIDLSRENAEALRDALAPYVTAARRQRGKVVDLASLPRPYQRRQPAVQVDADTATVRAWALQNGISVSDRGRVKEEVWRLYAQACGTAG